MFRIRSLSSLAYVLAGTVVLSACGGGGSHGTLPATNAALTPGTPVGSAPATFTFTFPKSTSSSNGRKTASVKSPKYLSSATASITLVVTDTLNAGNNSDIYANVPASLKVVQYFNPANLTDGASPGHCGTDPSNAGNYKCIATFQMPIGKDTTTITSWDASESSCTKNTSPSPPTCSTGHVLSSQVGTFTTTQGIANSFTVHLDANAAAMSLSTTSGFCAGTFTVTNGSSVPTVGTTALTFNASYTDPAGKTIVAPGVPVLSVNGHTDDNGGSGYTIAGTGGNVTVKVNQSSQSYTLQASGSGVSATINVAATPANTTGSSDGLSFNQALSYTFQAGTAPPASFFADAEQIINGSGVVTGGKVGLYTLSLGASDSFNANSPSQLSAQPGPGPAHSDVDFPNDLLFDGNGDLLIANGGSGNPDFGNFACVPAGAITTGANVATIIDSNGSTTTFDDPQFLALGDDTGKTVAITNTSFGSGSTPDLAEFTLSGTYVSDPTHDVLHSTYGSAGTHNVVALPAASSGQPAGTFAVSITDTTQSGTHVVFHHRDGSADQALPSDQNLTDPFIGYDPTNNQIIAADNNGTSSAMTCWSVSTRTRNCGPFTIYDDGSGNSNGVPSNVAVSSSGYVAVSYGVSVGPEIQIYDNTASHGKLKDPADHTTVLDPIGMDATTAAFGTTYVYGGANVTNINTCLRWITATKLLVCLYSQHAHVQSSANGIYIFDVTQNGQTQSGYDPLGRAYGKGPKQTGFLQLSNAPLSAAYKP
jgi:hypothetical protein